MRVVIVGAGLSGLTLATFLRRVNVDVVVLEQAPRLHTHYVPPYTLYASALGCYAAFAPAQLLDDVTCVHDVCCRVTNAQRRSLLHCRNRAVPLRARGVDGDDDDDDAATLCTTALPANYHSTASLRAREAARRAAARASVPLCVTADAARVRERLRRQLADVRFGCRVVDLLPLHDGVKGGVRVVLANGQTECGDVVVAADGAHSTIRRLLYPAEQAAMRRTAAHKEDNDDHTDTDNDIDFSNNSNDDDVLYIDGFVDTPTPPRGVVDGPVTWLAYGADTLRASSSSPSSSMCALTLTPHLHDDTVRVSFTATIARQQRQRRRRRALPFASSAAIGTASAHDATSRSLTPQHNNSNNNNNNNGSGGNTAHNNNDDDTDAYARALALAREHGNAADVTRLCCAALARDGRVYGDDVAALLARATVALPRVAYEVPIVPRWHNKRAVLLGDAAHGTVSSLLDCDASLCVEDAAVLTAALLDVPLHRDSGFAYAFGRYEAVRRPRVERAIRHTRRVRQLMLTRHTALRDALLRATPSYATYALHKWLLTWNYTTHIARTWHDVAMRTTGAV